MQRGDGSIRNHVSELLIEFSCYWRAWNRMGNLWTRYLESFSYIAVMNDDLQQTSLQIKWKKTLTATELTKLLHRNWKGTMSLRWKVTLNGQNAWRITVLVCYRSKKQQIHEWPSAIRRRIRASTTFVKIWHHQMHQQTRKITRASKITFISVNQSDIL